MVKQLRRAWVPFDRSRDSRGHAEQGPSCRGRPLRSCFSQRSRNSSPSWCAAVASTMREEGGSLTAVRLRLQRCVKGPGSNPLRAGGPDCSECSRVFVGLRTLRPVLWYFPLGPPWMTCGLSGDSSAGGRLEMSGMFQKRSSKMRRFPSFLQCLKLKAIGNHQILRPHHCIMVSTCLNHI